MPERRDVDVCVVGAGYAELTAARRLSQAGQSVVVLEARDRVGGRIWTTALDDGTPVDRGGAWLGPAHREMFALARDFNIPTYKTNVKGAHLLIDGERTRRYTGLIPKISPIAIASIVIAQAKIDRAARKVPLDTPWSTPNAAVLDSRTVADYLDACGVRKGIAHDLYSMAVRGLMTGELDDSSYLHLLYLVHAHGSINTLFSIDKGAQENLVSGGAGAMAAAMARELGDAVQLNAPARSIAQHEDHVVVEAGELTVAARYTVVATPPELTLEIAFDPALPGDRQLLYKNTIGGPESKTLVVYDEPFWRHLGFSGQTSEPGSASETTIDASPESGTPGVIVVLVRSGGRATGETRARRAAASRAGRSGRAVGGAGEVAGRVHRDRVVQRTVDSRLFVRAPTAGNAVAVRVIDPPTVGPGALGGNRNGNRVSRRNGRRDALGARAAAEILARANG